MNINFKIHFKALSQGNTLICCYYPFTFQLSVLFSSIMPIYIYKNILRYELKINITNSWCNIHLEHLNNHPISQSNNKIPEGIHIVNMTKSSEIKTCFDTSVAAFWTKLC